jgi:hypothetical protein
MLTKKEELIIEQAFFRGRMFETASKDTRPTLEEAIQKTKEEIDKKYNDELSQVIRLLTDPENQPHQYVKNPEALKKRLDEIL